MTDTMYPYSRFRYRLEIEGLEVGGFCEASGFDTCSDELDYRDDASINAPVKLQGMRKYSNITLKNGLTSSDVLYNWLMEGASGGVLRKTVTITAIDESATAFASWQIINAWPCKYTVPDFNAGSCELAIETLELVHEGITRVI